MKNREALRGPTEPVAERIAKIEQSTLAANLCQLLDEAAEEAPDTPAWFFFDSGESITYRDLRKQVDQLARGFSSLGIGPGTHVGVMAPNIAAFPLTWLALARLGAVMVPINIRYTARELHYVLTDSESRHLIIHPELHDILSEARQAYPDLVLERVISISDAQWDAFFTAADASPPALPAPGPDTLLNIQYTSGTTGFPKGCMLPHRYWLIVGKAHAFCDGMDYRRILISLPFFYMTAQWQFVMSLYQRATAYVAARQSATRFMSWVRAFDIDFCIVPTLAYKQPEHHADTDNMVVRANIYGFPKANHADLERRFGIIAREGYGMTEIGAGMFIPMEADDMVGSGSCGIPMPFREFRIVDENGVDVETGTVGELIVRGEGIMQGYYRKPEAMAKSYYGDWFRTGDLFKQDARGYYYIVGRTKDMIRRAGENIAAREIEEVLLEIPEIAEAAVIPVPDEIRGEEVKACLVLRDDASPDDIAPQAILDHCQAKLAIFKVPRYIEYRTRALPKTPSGKISKPPLIAETPDLRKGCWDRIENRWHS